MSNENKDEGEKETYPLTNHVTDTIDNDTNSKNHVANKELNPSDDDEKSEIAEDVRCGYWGWKPNFLQVCNNPKCLLLFMSIFAMTQGFVVNGVNNVNTSSLERRFQLSSSKVGFVSSAYDITAAVMGLIISYFVSKKNKPRMIAMAAVVMSVGSFIMSLPHFTTGLYHAGQNILKICKADSNTTQSTGCTEESDSSLQSYLYVLILGQVLHGFGGTTFHIVGVSLIDDSVPASSSPMYIGILYAVFTLGPAFGYILGGKLLDLYVDFDQVSKESIHLTPEDPRWVGAWWIGFVAGFVMFLSISLPLFGFGKELPDAEYVRRTRVSQVHENKIDEILSSSEKTTSIRDFPKTVLMLLRNPPFMFVTLAGAVEGLTISGFSTFMPKFVQNQFGVTASRASILGGLMVVPGASGGQFIGGLVCKRWKLKVKGMLQFIVGVSIVAIFIDNFVWIKCEQNNIAGVTSHYSNQSDSLPNLETSCNSNCSCTTEFYEPVCGKDGIQYFSACHAGCMDTSDKNKMFHNCSCISTSNGLNSTATSGKCGEGCKLMYVFLPLLLLMVFCIFVNSPAALSVTLRVIPENQKTFALGIQWFLIRIIGTVPGPIVFGALIDNACLVWQTNCDEEKAACWIYDNALLSRNFFFILMSVRLGVTVLFGLAYKVYIPPTSSHHEGKDLAISSACS